MSSAMMVSIGARCRDVRTVSPTETLARRNRDGAGNREDARNRRSEYFARGKWSLIAVVAARDQRLSCISRYAYRRPAAVKFAAD